MKRIAIALLLFSNSLVADYFLLIGNDVPLEITTDEAYFAYTLQMRHWPDGGAVTVIMLPPDAQESIAFADRVSGISPQRLQRLQQLHGTKSVGRVISFRDGQDAADHLVNLYGGIAYTRTDVVLDSRVTIIQLK